MADALAAYVARAAGVTREDARDAVQDAIGRASVRLDTIRNLRPWIAQTALHIAIDERRHRESARRALARVPVEDVSALTPERYLESAEALEALTAILADLSPRCREVVRWRYCDQLTARQVEVTHGIPARTVRYCLAVCARRLKSIHAL